VCGRLVIRNPGNTSSADIWMSYNLAIDPGEEKNVADQHPDVLQKMVAAYTKFVKDVGVVISRGWAYE
jgi:hypothetical protein